MATGFSRSSDRPRGRAVAAAQLEEFMLAGAPAARNWEEPPTRYTGRDRSLEEMIQQYGGTKGLAAATGRSQRTVQRWHREGTAHITARSREALEQANAQLNARERRAHGHQEWGELITRFGGTKGLARAIGVHQRTVQSWLSGAALPSDANLAKLQRADRGYRMAKTYGHLGVDPVRAKPTGRVHMKAAGRVRAVGGAGSPLYQYMRHIGISSLSDLGHELPPAVAHDMFNAMHDGNTTGALDVLQEHLSGAREGDPWSYAQCGVYDVEQDIGFFIDDFTDLQFN